MIISFHMGSPYRNESNTITFFEIDGKAQLETIKLITKNSKLLFNSCREESYKALSPDESHVAYNLTLYLPAFDKDFKTYSHFEYLFEHEFYLNWKEKITTRFPELLEQLTIKEKEAKNHQALYQAQEKLRHYTDEANGRHSFQHNKEHVQSLRDRINELRSELDPETGSRYEFK